MSAVHEIEDDVWELNGFRSTRHAEVRCNQRGIRRDDLKALLSAGGGEGSCIVLTASDIAAEIAEHKHQIASLQRLHGKMAVVAGGRLVTVYAETRSGRQARKHRS